MESIGIAILSFIIITPIIAIIKGIVKNVKRASYNRTYIKEVEKSSGLKKINLLVRKDSIFFTTGLKKQDKTALRANLVLPTSSAFLAIADSYYSLLNDSSEAIGAGSYFNKLAENLSTDYTKLKTISARIFGISFGITIAKAANLSGKKVKKTAVKKYLNTCDFDDKYKKDIIKMATMYINFEQDKSFGAYSERAFVSKDLGAMAYALIDEKLAKEDHADITIATNMNMATAIAYKETRFYNGCVLSEIEEAGLIG